ELVEARFLRPFAVGGENDWLRQIDRRARHRTAAAAATAAEAAAGTALSAAAAETPEIRLERFGAYVAEADLALAAGAVRQVPRRGAVERHRPQIVAMLHDEGCFVGGVAGDAIGGPRPRMIELD